MESSIDGSRTFYEDVIHPMIRKSFSQYESLIAVGIAGEGSDCFGYDDYVSRDHDFGTGVCLWVRDDDWDIFGSELSQMYDDCIANHPGNNLTERLKERRGVMTISLFYNNILGSDCYSRQCSMSDDMWLGLDHNCLATAVNGVVFRDDLGEFSAFRNMLLNYYPDKVWKIRIIDELHRFSQSLQVNYARCMTREDLVASSMCRMHGVDSAMQLFFLLKRIYPPYYKWTYKRLCELDETLRFAEWIKELSTAKIDTSKWEIGYDAKYINVADPIVRLSERIAGYIVDMMHDNNLTQGTDTYLERYVDELSLEFRD